MAEYLRSVQFFTIINTATMNIPGYANTFLHTLGVFLWATHPDVEYWEKSR